MERIIVRIQYKKIHDKHTTKNATLLYLSSLIKIVIKKNLVANNENWTRSQFVMKVFIGQ